MSDIVGIDTWVRERLNAIGERVESIGDPIAGTRADRHLIQTDRRRLVLKRFPRADEFAMRECRSYTLLSQRAPAIVPPVVAIDERARCILLQHIEGDDLFGALAADDPLDVMQALGESIALLIRATSTAEPIDQTAAEERRSLTINIGKLHGDLAAAGLHIGEAATQSMIAIAAAAEAAPLALTQGDPAPSNILFSPGARFIDFEYGATRHALFDLAQWYMRCPLPQEWFDVLTSSVWAGVVDRSDFVSRAQFDTQLRRMCQHAGVYMLTWLPLSAALQQDRSWVGSWSVRRALLCTLARLVSITDAEDPLRLTFEDLERSLHLQWTDVGDYRIDWGALIHSRRA